MNLTDVSAERLLRFGGTYSPGPSWAGSFLRRLEWVGHDDR